MRTFLFLQFSLLFLLAALFLNACGSDHGLKTLTIDPPTPDAQTFPDGKVQFTAMGSYGGTSQPAAVNAMWWSYQPWGTAPPTPPTYSLDSTGLAWCFDVAHGTFPVWATAPKDQTLPLSKMTKETSQLTATAQITCP